MGTLPMGKGTCLSLRVCAAQGSVFESRHVKVIWRRGGDVSAVRMTSPQVSRGCHFWRLPAQIIYFSLLISHTATTKDIRRQLHQSSLDCLPDRPLPSLMQATEKEKPPYHSFAPVLVFSSSGLWTFIYIFKRNSISSPAHPLWGLILVWSHCFRTLQGHGPHPISSTPPPFSILKPGHPSFCPQVLVNLYEFVRGFLFLSFSFSTSCPFPPFKYQCLTSTSCWLVFTGHQSNGGTGGKDKRRGGRSRGENHDKISSQYGTVRCLTLWWGWDVLHDS